MVVDAEDLLGLQRPPTCVNVGYVAQLLRLVTFVAPMFRTPSVPRGGFV